MVTTIKNRYADVFLYDATPQTAYSQTWTLWYLQWHPSVNSTLVFIWVSTKTSAWCCLFWPSPTCSLESGRAVLGTIRYFSGNTVWLVHIYTFPTVLKEKGGSNFRCCHIMYSHHCKCLAVKVCTPCSYDRWYGNRVLMHSHRCENTRFYSLFMDC